jgi:NAD(P)H-quinone oxidoreductase subunit 5
LLHLVAHSLYKAHAFLSSGSIVRLAKSSWAPANRPNAHPLRLAAAVAGAFTLVLVNAWMFGMDWQREPGMVLLGGAFAMALAYALWNLWGQTLTLNLAVLGVISGAAIVAANFLQHKLFRQFVAQGGWANPHLQSWPGLAVMVTLFALFLIVLVIQTELPQWASRPLFHALYVHARNGFYFNTLANRAVAALWPVSPSSPKR